MTKKRILFSVFVMMLASVLCLSSKTAYARTNHVNNLINKMEKASIKDIKDSAEALYKNNVASTLIGHKQNLVFSNVTDEAINNATLSAPLPIFASKVKYNKGEDFKSKLEHIGFQFIVYVEGNPIASFSTDKQNGKYVVTNVINENFAKSCSHAISQLNSNNIVVLCAGGYYFMADDNDNVAFVNPFGNTEEKYVVKSFDELNNAENKTIDYYSNKTEIEYGGSVLFDYLYGNSAANISSNTTFIIVLVIASSSLLLAIILFKNRKFKVLKR